MRPCDVARVRRSAHASRPAGTRSGRSCPAPTSRLRLASMWWRNWRAHSRQVKRSECSRARCARDFERGEAGGAQVVVERAGAAVADHVERPGDRERGDRQAARQRLDHDDAEGVGLARERRRRRRWRRRAPAPRRTARRGNARADSAARARARAGPSPTMTTEPGSFEVEQRLEVLLHRDAADARGRSAAAGRARRRGRGR